MRCRTRSTMTRFFYCGTGPNSCVSCKTTRHPRRNNSLKDERHVRVGLAG